MSAQKLTIRHIEFIFRHDLHITIMIIIMVMMMLMMIMMMMMMMMIIIWVDNLVFSLF